MREESDVEYLREESDVENATTTGKQSQKHMHLRRQTDCDAADRRDVDARRQPARLTCARSSEL